MYILNHYWCVCGDHLLMLINIKHCFIMIVKNDQCILFMITFNVPLHLSVHKSCYIPCNTQALGCMCFMRLSANWRDNDDTALVLCMAYFFRDDDAMQDHWPHYPALKTPLIFVCLCQKKETLTFLKDGKAKRQCYSKTFKQCFSNHSTYNFMIHSFCHLKHIYSDSVFKLNYIICCTR